MSVVNSYLSTFLGYSRAAVGLENTESCHNVVLCNVTTAVNLFVYLDAQSKAQVIRACLCVPYCPCLLPGLFHCPIILAPLEPVLILWLLLQPNATRIIQSFLHIDSGRSTNMAVYPYPQSTKVIFSAVWDGTSGWPLDLLHPVTGPLHPGQLHSSQMHLNFGHLHPFFLHPGNLWSNIYSLILKCKGRVNILTVQSYTALEWWGQPPSLHHILMQ